jgi:hypothetical protein
MTKSCPTAEELAAGHCPATDGRTIRCCDALSARGCERMQIATEARPALRLRRPVDLVPPLHRSPDADAGAGGLGRHLPAALRPLQSVYPVARQGRLTIVCLSRSGDHSTPQDPNNPACGNLRPCRPGARERIGRDLHRRAVEGGPARQLRHPGLGATMGHYSTICADPDPRYPRRVWAINQFALQRGDTTSQWCNAIASIDFG